MNDVLEQIECWYANHCDGAWEHQYGLLIETIDNPGWRIQIDLVGTPLLKQTFSEIIIDRSETDWLRCGVRSGKFEGFGGSRNLRELLLVFLTWVQQQSN